MTERPRHETGLLSTGRYGLYTQVIVQRVEDGLRTRAGEFRVRRIPAPTPTPGSDTTGGRGIVEPELRGERKFGRP